MAREMATACIEDYRKFEFHLVAQRLQNFCSEDLGGFWLDILKDRLYTLPVDSKARRSAQSALHHVTQLVLRLMAPILSFTAEEAWAVLHPGTDESIFFQTWTQVLPPQDGEAQLREKWKRLREIRGRGREEARGGRASPAPSARRCRPRSRIEAGGDDLAALQSLGEDLRYVLITSKATLRAATAEGVASIDVVASPHAKCERCWHYRPDVGADPAHPGICARCAANLAGPGEVRRHA